jgi:hypothetical protein
MVDGRAEVLQGGVDTRLGEFYVAVVTERGLKRDRGLESVMGAPHPRGIGRQHGRSLRAEFGRSLIESPQHGNPL